VTTSALLLAACVPTRGAEAQSQQPAIAAIHAGFDGAYKLGAWTQLRVEIQPGDDANVAAFNSRLEVTAQDPDGVPATFTTPPDKPLRIAPGATTTATLFVRFGQAGAPVTLRLLDEDDRPRATRAMTPNVDAEPGALRTGLPAASRLLVTFGSQQGLNDLARGESDDAPANALRIIRLKSAADLPTEWFGYEGVETLVLSGGDVDLFGDLAPDDPRIAALSRWVELGGEVVFFCGATAPQLIGANGPLAALVPGKFTGEFAPLPDPTPLELFSGAAITLRRDGRKLSIPRLVEVTGEVVVQGGRNEAELPLVVRQRRGFGEITFVAIDPDEPPIDKWSERIAMIRQALRWPSAAAQAAAESRGPAARGGGDLVNQLRTALDSQLAGVTVAPFALVAALVLAYVALIGPGDYFLLKRIKRPELTWVTFPLIIIASSAAAWWFAHRLKGDELRINQLEFVDVDLATGQARGTAYAYLFSPSIKRYDLALEPHFGPSPLAPRPSSLVAPLAVPGPNQRGLASLFQRGYAFTPALDAMHGVPVEQWSTKSLTARWTATLSADSTIEAELEPRPDGLLAGRIVNRTGVALDDCVLMHGAWAYQLPPLAADATATIDAELTPRTVRTTLTSVAAGDDPTTRPSEDGSVRFDVASTDVARIAKVMMFYNALGGAAYVRTPHRYQPFLDMSRLLRGDQAILLARAPKTAGSDWTDGDNPLASPADRRWTYYRFVIPLNSTTQNAQPRPVIGPQPVPPQ
jgi:hypothetical protein